MAGAGTGGEGESGSRVEKWKGDAPPAANEIEAQLREEGFEPRAWSNGPGDRYGWHEHAYHKVLYCVSGSIDFHTRDGDLCLSAGDRLEIDPGTPHAATVGPDGVSCLEAPRGRRENDG